MAVDTPKVQRGIAKWTLVASSLLGGLTYLLGAKQFAYGLGFGVVLTIVNYKVVAVILDVAMKAASPGIARVISFVSYHVRFWLIVIILYIVIPKTHYLFGVGTFAGILLPKMIMGVFVVLHTDDEWWNKEVETQQAPPEGTVIKKKGEEEEGLRFPGIDFDERFKNDQRFNDSNGNLKL